MKPLALAIALLALLGSTPGSASVLSDTADTRHIVHGELLSAHGEAVEFVLSPGEARLSIGGQDSRVYFLQIEEVDGDRVWVRIDEAFDRAHDEVLASQSLELRLGMTADDLLAPVALRLTGVTLGQCPVNQGRLDGGLLAGGDTLTRDSCCVRCNGQPPVCCSNVPAGQCCGAYASCGDCTAGDCDGPSIQ